MYRGKEFESKRNKQIYCSKNCSSSNRKHTEYSKKLMSLKKKRKNNPMYGISPSFKSPFIFFSVKNNKNLICRSSYEIKAFNILENDNNVVKYEYEKIKVPYMDKKGSERTTIVDLLIKYNNNQYKLVEIKPERMMKLWNNKEKIEAIKDYSKRNDIIFEIWNENYLISEYNTKEVC